MTLSVPNSSVLCGSVFSHPLTGQKERSSSKNLWCPVGLADKWTANAVFCKGLRQILLVSGSLTKQGIGGRERELIDLKQKTRPVKILLLTLECWNGHLVRVEDPFLLNTCRKIPAKMQQKYIQSLEIVLFPALVGNICIPWRSDCVLILVRASVELPIAQRDFSPSLVRENSFKLVRLYLRKAVIICAAVDVSYRIWRC